ncbi:hypothetical protein AALO_G00175090 [Alosa alosa]|uniref:Uncharacterized protein n=1 Tax=Alosa alosa TaxID=278164 RepID=A0AAV6G851_9TELE|nr:hypothetical protein AALO_G00175090 [Alosa alosa]
MVTSAGVSTRLVQVDKHMPGQTWSVQVARPAGYEARKRGHQRNLNRLLVFAIMTRKRTGVTHLLGSPFSSISF